MRPVLALSIVLLFWLSPEAHAAMASVGDSTQFLSGSQRAVLYAAAPGERNRVVAGADPGSEYPYDIVVRDTGAIVTAGPGCTAIDEHGVRCPAEPGVAPYLSRRMLSLSIDVGDGDDVVSMPTSFVTPIVVTAGDGNDFVTGAGRISGGAGNDTLTGGDDGPGYKGSGPPSDALAGGPGDDVLRGGNGDDELVADAGNDVIDGGPGEQDRVWYGDRADGVRVDLADAEAFAGEPGERDRVSGVEQVVGGAGDDVLLGSAVRNSLEGGAGDDRLVGRDGWDRLVGGTGEDVLDGRAGNDDLYGEAGADTLRGGAGNDDLQSGGNGDVLDGGPGHDSFFAGRPRALRCGAGRDVVGIPRGTLLTGCESVVVGARRFPAYSDTATIAVKPRRRRDGGLVFGWACDATAGRCDLRVTVRTGSTLVGRRSAVLLKRGATGELVAAQRRSTRRGRMLEVSIAGAVYQAYIPGGRTKRFTARWRIRL